MNKVIHLISHIIDPHISAAYRITLQYPKNTPVAFTFSLQLASYL